MAENGKCSNCGIEAEKGKDKCPFCSKFGGENPKNLLEIKQFSEYHFGRGLCKQLDMD